MTDGQLDGKLYMTDVQLDGSFYIADGHLRKPITLLFTTDKKGIRSDRDVQMRQQKMLLNYFSVRLTIQIRV